MKKFFTVCFMIVCVLFTSVNSSNGACTQQAGGDGTCVAMLTVHMDPITGEKYFMVSHYYCSDQAGTRNCIMQPE